MFEGLELLAGLKILSLDSSKALKTVYAVLNGTWVLYESIYNLNQYSKNIVKVCDKERVLDTARFIVYTVMPKEVFRTCNVLPFSCTHLALWRGKEEGKNH